MSAGETAPVIPWMKIKLLTVPQVANCPYRAKTSSEVFYSRKRLYSSGHHLLVE